MAGSERGTDRDSRANSLRIKKLKTKASTGSLGQAYNGGATPSLLNGKGEAQSVPGLSESVAPAGFHSPAHSRSSSAQGSYSTSATTFEEPEEKRLAGDDTGDRHRGRDSGSREKETKGNVIVSVRVRPDAGGDKTSARDWLVDGRRSLVAYRGREGGDYYYGKSAQARLSRSLSQLSTMADSEQWFWHVCMGQVLAYSVQHWAEHASLQYLFATLTDVRLQTTSLHLMTKITRFMTRPPNDWYIV